MLIVLPIAFSIGQYEMTADEKADADLLLSPIWKLVRLAQYAATGIAALAYTFAGIVFLFAGQDPSLRDMSKMIATYTTGGLIFVWAVPTLIKIFSNF